MSLNTSIFFLFKLLRGFNYRSQEEWAAISKRANENGLTLEYRKADITDGEGINELVQKVAQEAPAPLRVLVHCAASMVSSVSSCLNAF